MDHTVGIEWSAERFRVVTAGRGTTESAELAITPRGEPLVGAAAAHAVSAGAAELFRDFADRAGDPVPVIGAQGGARLGADLVALTVGALLTADDRSATHLVLAHPASWSGYQRAVLRSALTCTAAAGIPTTLVSRPVAALAGLDGEAGPALVVEVGRLATDVALVDRGSVLDTGGTDMAGAEAWDRALAGHVLSQLAGAVDRTGRGELLDRCRAAREELATHPATVVEVRTAAGAERIRVVRADFEDLARDGVSSVVAAVAEVTARAARRDVPVRVVLVVGPAAGTPLLVGALGRREDSRVVVPSGPEWAVALGAVRLARQPAGPVPAPMRTTGPSHDPRPRTTVEPSPSPPPGAVRSAPPTRSTGAPTAPPATRTAGADARSGGTRVRAAVIGIAAAFALLVGGGWAVSGAAGGHGGGGAGLSMSWGGHGH